MEGSFAVTKTETDMKSEGEMLLFIKKATTEIVAEQKRVSPHFFALKLTPSEPENDMFMVDLSENFENKMKVSVIFDALGHFVKQISPQIVAFISEIYFKKINSIDPENKDLLEGTKTLADTEAKEEGVLITIQNPNEELYYIAPIKIENGKRILQEILQLPPDRHTRVDFYKRGSHAR